MNTTGKGVFRGSQTPARPCGDETMSWHPPPAGVSITSGGATRSAVCRDSPGGDKAFGIMLLQQGWN